MKKLLCILGLIFATVAHAQTQAVTINLTTGNVTNSSPVNFATQKLGVAGGFFDTTARADGYVIFYNGTSGNYEFEAGGGGGGAVSSVTGTANQITASPTTGAVVLTAPGTYSGGNTVVWTTGLASGNYVLPLINSTLDYVKRTTVADADYTVLATDRYIAVTSISASRILTLPAASTVTPGATMVVSDESGSVTNSRTIVVLPNGTDTISGSNTQFWISSPYGQIILVCNGGTKWIAVSDGLIGTDSVVVGSRSYGIANTTVLGTRALATSSRDVAIGISANASGGTSMALGGSSVASGSNTIAVGDGATASNSAAVAIGVNATASGPVAVAVGMGTNATATSTVALGWTASANTSGGMAIGSQTVSNSSGAIAIGLSSAARTPDSIAIGHNALTGNVAGIGLDNAIAIGLNATAAPTTGTNGDSGIAIGPFAKADSWRATALGGYAEAVQVSSTAIGLGAFSFGAHSESIGRSAWTLKSNYATIGGNGIGNIYFQNGYAGIYYDGLIRIPGTPQLDNQVGNQTILHGIDGRDLSAAVYFTDSATTPTGNAAWGFLTVNATGVPTALTMVDTGGGYTAGNITAVALGAGTLPAFTYTLSGGAIISATLSGGSGMNPTTASSAGGNINIAAGMSTGSGTGGNVNLQVSNGTAAANNTVNNLVTGLSVAPINGTASLTTVTGNLVVTGNANGTWNGTVAGLTANSYSYGNSTGFLTGLSAPNSTMFGRYSDGTFTAFTLANITQSATTIDLTSTAVTPGSYNFSNLTVDSKGRITAIATGVPSGSGTVTSVTSADTNIGVATTTTTPVLTLNTTLAGATFNFNGTTASTTTLTGTIITGGGIGVAKAAFIGGTLNVTGASTLAGDVNVSSSTASTTTTSGAIITAGGLGVAKNLFVGGTSNVTGNATITGTRLNFPTNVSMITGPMGGSFANRLAFQTNDGTFTKIHVMAGETGTANSVAGFNFVAFNSTANTPYLSMELSGDNAADGNTGMFLNLGHLGSGLTGNVYVWQADGGNIAVLTKAGIFTLNATTASTSTTTGALVVGGGLGVAGNINGGGTLTTTGAVNGQVITVSANIDAKTSGNTTIYTPTSGKNATIVSIAIENLVTTSVTIPAQVTFSAGATTNDVTTSLTLTTPTAGQEFKPVFATEPFWCNNSAPLTMRITVGSTATTHTIKIIVTAIEYTP